MEPLKAAVLALSLLARCRCTTVELQRLCAETAEASLFHMGSCYVTVWVAASYTAHSDATCVNHALGQKYKGHLACPFRNGLAELLYATILPSSGHIFTCLSKPDAAVVGTYAFYYNTTTKLADVDLPHTLFQWDAGSGARASRPATVLHVSWDVMQDYPNSGSRHAVCEYRAPRDDNPRVQYSATRRFRRAATGRRPAASLTIATSEERNSLQCIRKCAALPLCHCVGYSTATLQCRVAIVHCDNTGATEEDTGDGTSAVYQEEP